MGKRTAEAQSPPPIEAPISVKDSTLRDSLQDRKTNSDSQLTKVMARTAEPTSTNVIFRIETIFVMDEKPFKTQKAQIEDLFRSRE